MDQPPDAIEKESPTQFEFYSCSFQLSFVVTLGEIYQLSSVTCDFDSSSSDPRLLVHSGARSARPATRGALRARACYAQTKLPIPVVRSLL